MTKQSTALTNRNSDKFMLRLPDGMRDAIAEFAKQSGRSMNAEIVYRLQQWLDNEQEQHADGFHTIDMKVIDHRNYPPQIGDALRKIEDELRAVRETLKVVETHKG